MYHEAIDVARVLLLVIVLQAGSTVACRAICATKSKEATAKNSATFTRMYTYTLSGEAPVMGK